MGIVKLNLPTYKREVGGQELVFHGLSFYALTGIIKRHRDELDKLFKMGQEAVEADEDFSIADMAFDVLTDSPQLVASIIAYSAKDPDSASVMLDIPFPDQLEIIEQIATLTFEGFGDAGKFFGLVARIFNKISNTMGA